VISASETLITIDGEMKLEHSLCGECNPQAPDKIIAKAWAHGIKIHRIDCESLKSISYDKLLECHRGSDTSSCEIYYVKFTIQLTNKHWSLMSLLSLFHHLNINVTNVSFEHNTSDVSQGIITWAFNIPSKIYYVIKQLEDHHDYYIISSTLL
jgi:(p)ppGpp synthase/HD superfamily hydrolase